MIIFKIIIDLICGALNAWGGYSWHNARRFIMPTMIGLAVAFITSVWWAMFLPLPAMGTLCLGYHSYGNFGRALWIGLQCFALGLGLLLTGHLHWYFYLPYIVGGCVLGGLYRNWQQIIGDICTGCYMGLIIFLIH
jgi:hypothetical protein